MSLDAKVIEKLSKPLDPSRVKHREGSGGRSLSYLEGHDVIRAANDAFGIGNWGYAVEELVCLGEEPVTSKYDKPGFRVAYRATVKAGTDNVGYSDVGYGDAMEYTGSKLTPHELASKEAVTDALKRALKNFGDQFGLCLYDKFAPEHNGSVSRPGGQSDSGRAGSQSASPDSPAPKIDGWTFPSGKHAGKTLDQIETEGERGYIEWYAASGPKQDVREICNAFLLGGELVSVGATEIRDGYTDPEEIPFMPTIDGLGN